MAAISWRISAIEFNRTFPKRLARPVDNPLFIARRYQPLIRQLSTDYCGACAEKLLEIDGTDRASERLRTPGDILLWYINTTFACRFRVIVYYSQRRTEEYYFRAIKFGEQS